MEQVAKAIGYVVYAVASADNHVALEEKKIAHDLINEHWTLLADNEDPFGVRSLDFVDKIIVSFDEDHLDSEKAFDSFKEIFEEQKNDFTPEIKQFILDLCIKVGSAFNQMNKSELVLLSRIEMLLKK
jgi:hypothetical protein